MEVEFVSITEGSVERSRPRVSQSIRHSARVAHAHAGISRACLIWAKLCARARQLQGAVFDFVYLFPGLSLWMQKNILSLGSGRTLLMSVFLEPCSFRRLCSSSVTSPRSPPSSPRSTAESEPVALSLMPPPAGERRRRPWVARRRPVSGGAAARSPCALVGALGSARGRQRR